MLIKYRKGRASKPEGLLLKAFGRSMIADNEKNNSVNSP